MNSKQLNIFKLFLFVVGILIVAIAFAIVNNPYPETGLTNSQKFFWMEILICYLVFSFPFFFGSINLKSIDTKITSTVHVWISVIIFEITAIMLAVCSLNDVIKVRTAILIELILIFFLAIFIFYGYIAGNHIGNVQSQEQKSLNKISELKSVFDMLNLKKDLWGEDFFEQKATVRKLCDDVKFMSPVDSDLASNLEQKLIAAANVLTESDLSPKELSSKLTELSNLINQRKLLRK